MPKYTGSFVPTFPSVPPMQDPAYAAEHRVRLGMEWWGDQLMRERMVSYLRGRARQPHGEVSWALEYNRKGATTLTTYVGQDTDYASAFVGILRVDS